VRERGICILHNNRGWFSVGDLHIDGRASVERPIYGWGQRRYIRRRELFAGDSVCDWRSKWRRRLGDVGFKTGKLRNGWDSPSFCRGMNQWNFPQMALVSTAILLTGCTTTASPSAGVGPQSLASEVSQTDSSVKSHDETAAASVEDSFLAGYEIVSLPVTHVNLMPPLPKPQPEWTALKTSAASLMIQIKWADSAAKGCGQVNHIYVVESSNKVEIGLTKELVKLAPGMACPSAARNVSAKISLTAQIGRRQLIRVL